MQFNAVQNSCQDCSFFPGPSPPLLDTPSSSGSHLLCCILKRYSVISQNYVFVLEVAQIIMVFLSVEREERKNELGDFSRNNSTSLTGIHPVLHHKNKTNRMAGIYVNLSNLDTYCKEMCASPVDPSQRTMY